MPDLPLRVKIVDGHPVPENPEDCEPHTPSPDGYLQWHEWCEKMSRTHVQRQCRGCGLWAVWEPKEEVSASPERPGAPVFGPHQLLAARHDHPDATGPVVGWEPIPEVPDERT